MQQSAKSPPSMVGLNPTLLVLYPCNVAVLACSLHALVCYECIFLFFSLLIFPHFFVFAFFPIKMSLCIW